MGVEDREWWKEAQRERDGANMQRPSRFGRAVDRGPPAQHDDRGLTPGLKWGPLVIVVFWLLVMAIVYGGIKLVMKPREVTISMAGEMTIPRARDGHFYAPGTIGGQPVVFLVDTGASYVTVSQAFADHAGIHGGSPTRFHTANGVIEGRIVSDVPVSLGPAAVSGVKVAVGMNGIGRDQALLGQSFLSKFQITLSGNEMVLRRP
ncbi:retropepsin-like aspartic protease [Comamonadaceae bacterium G21597-S1]|nr:retropepsin-like aspartic protease [Comamonadaceae bacterium G21597-S1]